MVEGRYQRHAAVAPFLADGVKMLAQQFGMGLRRQEVIQIPVQTTPESLDQVAFGIVQPFLAAMGGQDCLAADDTAAVRRKAAVEGVAEVGKGHCRQMSHAIGTGGGRGLAAGAVGHQPVHPADVKATAVVDHGQHSGFPVFNGVQPGLNAVDYLLGGVREISVTDSLVIFHRFPKSGGVPFGIREFRAAEGFHLKAHLGRGFAGFYGGIQGVLEQFPHNTGRPQVAKRRRAERRKAVNGRGGAELQGRHWLTSYGQNL